MSKNIVVIGAGHGGLYAAALLAKQGHKVTVYEKSPRDSVNHNRTDCIECKLFDELPITPPEGSFRAAACSFMVPYTDVPLMLAIPESGRDITVERGDFVRMLADMATENGAEVIFDTAVDSIIIEGLSVKGIVVDGKEILADLVIDSSGIFSPFRASLPPVLGIVANPEKEEVFNIRHAYYDRTPGIEQPPIEYTWKMYVKYMCKNSISWVNCELPGEVGTLVGKIGEFEEGESDEILAQLKKDNPIIGENIIPGRGDYFAPIPVRYPSPAFVADGYCLIGDAAFMAVPLTGCGMANSLRAAKILADEVAASGDVDTETLTRYQAKYFKKVGAACCLIDCLKRGLLKSDASELRYLIESGVITTADVEMIFSGNIKPIPFNDLVSRISKLPKARKTLGTIIGYALKGVAAMAVASNPPRHYDLVEFARFRRRLETFYK